MSYHARKLGGVLRELREARGLSQEQLGELANVHRTYIGKVERGEKDISLRTATKLAAALGKKLSLIIDAFEGSERSIEKTVLAPLLTPRILNRAESQGQARKKGARR